MPRKPESNVPFPSEELREALELAGQAAEAGNPEPLRVAIDGIHAIVWDMVYGERASEEEDVRAAR